MRRDRLGVFRSAVISNFSHPFLSFSAQNLRHHHSPPRTDITSSRLLQRDAEEDAPDHLRQPFAVPGDAAAAAPPRHRLRHRRRARGRVRRAAHRPTQVRMELIHSCGGDLANQGVVQF